jgi:hypothetical protein
MTAVIHLATVGRTTCTVGRRDTEELVASVTLDLASAEAV